MINKKDKKIVFCPYNNIHMSEEFDSWEELENMVYKWYYPFVFTRQMGFMSTDLWKLGYEIYIYGGDKKCHKIQDLTDRELRPAHNLFMMWKSGVFDI